MTLDNAKSPVAHVNLNVKHASYTTPYISTYTTLNLGYVSQVATQAEAARTEKEEVPILKSCRVHPKHTRCMRAVCACACVCMYVCA